MMQKLRYVLLFAFLAPMLAPLQPIEAAGSTIPVFLVDVNNPSSFTFTGTAVNSAVTESANGTSGTANSLTVENSTVTNTLIFGTNKYLSFANNVKPDLTSGASMQFVAYLTSSSYNNSWPRVLDFGSTSGWGSGYDNFSIQLSDTGQLQVYMSRSGTTGVYTCGTNASAVLANAFAMYSIQVGPSGVCNIAVNGAAAATTTSEATTSFAGKVPNTATTMNFRVGSMSNAVQSTLPSGKIRTMIFSSGTTSTNAVTFMENGGSGYMASQLGSTSAALNSNLYTRTGYSFTGWNTKSDGTGTTYLDGATYNFASSQMLFAQWAVVPPSVTISTLATATYRTASTITATINSSGTYTFYESGKRLPGCISKSAAPATVTCSWKPSRLGRLPIYVVGKVSGTNYTSNTIYVNVANRSNTR
jgi:Listeria-Bacteroides repeat domain (List_Bact_rpt)